MKVRPSNCWSSRTLGLIEPQVGVAQGANSTIAGLAIQTNKMLSQESFFPCPACGEIIGSHSSNCKYCNAEIDPEAAEIAATFNRKLTRLVTTQAWPRNTAGVMWIAFAMQFLFAAMGRLTIIGMMLAVPVMLIRWQSRIGGIKTNDVDFTTARRNRNIALLLWLPTPIVIVLALLIFTGRF